MSRTAGVRGVSFASNQKNAMKQNNATNKPIALHISDLPMPSTKSPSSGCDGELRARLLAAVEAFDEPYRSVLRLRFFEDLPPTQIAERLALPVETVRTRLKRALVRVQAHLRVGA